MWTRRPSIYGNYNCERVPREFHRIDGSFKSLIYLLSDPSYPATTPAPNTGTFDMTVICPPFVFGPWVHPLGPSGLASLNDSNCQIRNIVRGDYLSSQLPQSFAPLWVDVRDVALAHVEAALRLGPGPSSNGRYTICSPERFTYHLVGEIIREEFPEWAEEVPGGARQRTVRHATVTPVGLNHTSGVLDRGYFSKNTHSSISGA